MFKLYDLAQLSAAGISAAAAEEQLQNFREGFPPLPITAPATVGHGILQMDEATQAALVNRFESWGGTRLKFVPASGAASRMFKALFEAHDRLHRFPTTVIEEHELVTFFKHLPQFAFYEELMRLPGVHENDRLSVLTALLTAKGLDYGALPKGLLLFHRYANGARTAFEEHLVEAALYAKDARGVARLHFTVSPEHRERFAALVEKVVPTYEQRYDVRYEIRFSEQLPSTDTLAVDAHNVPFRQSDGSLLLRPGGHGALLENLNGVDEDVVFVKNIDNVVPDALKPVTVHWKKVLAGLLLQLREQIHHYMTELETVETDSYPIKLKEVATFLANTFCITLPEVPAREYAPLLMAKLNRPLRVCGMVPNVGEPGGGPFVARNPDGSQSLQIVESAQLNLMDADTKRLFEGSTHFNPVDLVCSFRDYAGGRFDLHRFRDPATGLISTKSKDGKTLKAQELPGLWNGAMSDWNTVFVEVPLLTFNPVKTVNDLLRKEHC